LERNGRHPPALPGGFPGGGRGLGGRFHPGRGPGGSAGI